MRSARLVADGAADAVLVYPLRWLLDRLSDEPFDLQVMDLRHHPARPSTVTERIDVAFREGGFELLFVHRDAEREPLQTRRAEILQGLGARQGVPVVPVRMTEAWLLHDEQAIRTAANRPAGREPLGLPRPREIEGRPDPKALLHAALEAAHGQLPSRRRRSLDLRGGVHRIAELIRDWSPLLELAAFRQLEADTRAALGALGRPGRRGSPRRNRASQ